MAGRHVRSGEDAGGVALAERAGRTVPAASPLGSLSRRLGALQCVTEPGLSLLPVPQLLDQLVERARRVLDADEASLLVVPDDDRSVLEVRASRGVGGRPSEVPAPRVPIGQGFAGRVARERRAIVVDDMRAHPVVRPGLRTLRSMVGVPLLVRGRLVGVLHVGTRQARAFVQEDVDILLLVGDRAAVTIDRARAFDDLRRSEERLHLALDAADLGTFDGVVPTGIVALDARARAMLGTDAPTQTFDELLARVPAADRDAVCEGFRRALDPVTGGPYEDEFWIGTPRKRIHAHGRVCFSGGGRPLRFTGVLADVTRRHESEAQMGRLNAWLEDRVALRTRELEDANRELQAFSDSVTHDLRAPLRSIAGFAALLEERSADHLTAADHRDLARIRAAAARAATIMDDLLGLSRVGRCPLAARPLDLAELAREAVAALRQADPQRTVDVRIPTRLPAVGDPGLVRILLDNLLGNAWKFSRPSAAPVIELGVEDTDAGPVYFVRDNGVGFDPSTADRLFLPFERLHDNRAFEGTGIGLATAQRIVARHGGTISGTSTLGEGATFRFTLPRS